MTHKFAEFRPGRDRAQRLTKGYASYGAVSKGGTINVVIGAPRLPAAFPAVPQPALASGPDRGPGGVPVKRPLDLDGAAVDRHGGKRARGGAVKSKGRG